MHERQVVDLTYKPKKILSSCGDGRFTNTFRGAAKRDEVSTEESPANELIIPGPSISFVSEESKEIMLGWVAAYIEFFEADTLVVYDHMPCGWMKKKVKGYAEADDQGKLELTKVTIRAAGEVIRQTFPNLKLEQRLYGPDGEDIGLD